MSKDLVALIDQASDEELDKILAQLEMAEDFPTYCENVLRVQTPQGKLVPFVLNGPQRILHKIIEEHIRPKRPVRLVALKARRMGFSTYFSGLFYRGTSCQQNRYALQLTHEPDATDFLFKMVKRFHNLSPPSFKPETQYNNAKLLEFNNTRGTGLNSAFRVATAGKDDPGSGQLVTYLHMSEAAKYPASKFKELLASLLPCVPDDDEAIIVFESTAKGIGGEFYERFWNSRYHISVSKMDKNGEPVIVETINEQAPEDNIYTSVFLPWFCFEQYQIKAPVNFKLMPDEEEIKDQYGLSNDQMAWRRWVLANKCNNDIDVLNQEYPASAIHAFVGTGRPVFKNVMKLLAMSEAAEEPKARYEHHAGNWVVSQGGRLRVWKEPEPGEQYIIAADVAEGLVSGDFSVADVINHRTGEQVAQWHGNLDADNIVEFGDILVSLGHRYNTALVAPERNNHGLSVVTQMYHLKYPRLYSEMVPDPPGKPRKRLGWVTSRTTRPLIIDNLIREFQEESLGVACKETFQEMISFKIQDNGKMEADSGCHDDRVISLAIAKHLRQVVPLPAMNRYQGGRPGYQPQKRPVIPVEAWT